jgi:ribokinase
MDQPDNPTPTQSVAVVGSLNIDRVLRVPSLPAPGETVMVNEVDRVAGGKGLNQAVAARRAGVPVRLIGAIGGDDDGRWLLDHLDGDQVETGSVALFPDARSGTATVMVDARGRNAIVVDPGANRALAPDQVERLLAGPAAVTLVSCEIAVGSVVAALEAGSGIRILNPAPATGIGDDVLALCDLVTPNFSELTTLVGPDSGLSGSEHDVEAEPDNRVDQVVDAARVLQHRHPELVVVATIGAAGVVIIEPGAVTRVRAPLVTPVDTTGAGDCFNGYLAAELARDVPLHDACDRAVRAASLSVTRVGTSISMPHRIELDEAPSPT